MELDYKELWDSLKMMLDYWYNDIDRNDDDKKVSEKMLYHAISDYMKILEIEQSRDKDDEDE